MKKSSAGAGRRGRKSRSTQLKRLRKDRKKHLAKVEKAKQKERDIKEIRLAVRTACSKSRDGFARLVGRSVLSNRAYSADGSTKYDGALIRSWSEMADWELVRMKAAEWQPNKALSPLEQLAKTAPQGG